MVTNWNPWGKKGNGAPNDDIRIRNLGMDGLYPVTKYVHVDKCCCKKKCLYF